MNSMDLFKAFGDIDESLMFDAISGGAQPQNSPGVVPVKQPRNNGPRRGGAKTKAIVIGAVAIVLAAAITCLVLYLAGVIGGKQIPIYTGMEISAVDTTSSTNSTNAVSHKYSGDYYGWTDGIDKNNPFGEGNSTLEQQAQSILQVTGAGEDIYYADAGDDIYVTIKFYNPDEYDIVSFVLSDGTTETRYGGTYGMFESGSNYEQIIIKLNVGTTGGIIEYTISEIKYLDDNNVNSDVIIDGETVVKCGVRESGMTYAEISDETAEINSISFTVEIVDKYSLIAYSDGYVKAVLYDGESIIQSEDLQVGTNSVAFSGLSQNTVYQYAIVTVYDDFSGSGVALNYLYTNTVYTPAIVLFDDVEVTDSGVTFGYSWYTGYRGTITSLTLTGGGTTKTLSASAVSAAGLDSYTDYTLTANYTAANGNSASITLEFTTLPKVEVNSISIANTSSVSEGDSIVVQAEMYNPDGVTYNSVVINGTEYSVSSLSTKTKLRIEIMNNGQFAGGETTLTISKITCTINDETFSVDIAENNATSVFINGELAVENFSIVRLNENGEYEETNYGFYSEQLYYQISLFNSTCYDVYSVKIDGTIYDKNSIAMSADYQFVHIAINKVRTGGQDTSLNSISYSNSTIDKTKSLELNSYFVRLSSDEIVEIKTVDDLLNMDDFDYKYYKLMNDIDLSGYEWINMKNSMSGVFDGNGHSIKNMSAVTSCTDTSLYLGLFERATGVITNLSIINALYMVNIESTNGNNYSLYAGAIAPHSSGCVIDNVNVDISIQINGGSALSGACIGGLVGYPNLVYRVDNITVNAVVEISANYINSMWVGGLFGNVNIYGNKTFKNIESDLTLNVTTTGNIMYVGGLIGFPSTGGNFTIVNATVKTKATINYSTYNLNFGGVLGAICSSTINLFNVNVELTADIITSSSGLVESGIYYGFNGEGYEVNIDTSSSATADITKTIDGDT